MNDDKVAVTFTCQRCQKPLALDGSLDSINEHAMAELSLPIYASNADEMDPNESGFDHVVPPFRLSDSINGTGFTFVSDGKEIKKLSTELLARAQLFDALSSNSEFDHPLCDECTDSMMELLERELKIAEDEWRDYKSHLEKLEKCEDRPNINELRKELGDLEIKEKALVEELSELRKQEATLNDEIKIEESEKEKLAEQENIYWRDYTKHRRDLMLTEDDQKSLEHQISYVEGHLERLRNTNIFNVAFHIWHAGHFGTINNFRLGRLPSASVDWSEINAAWGQTVLLLCALARKIGLTFEKYRLVPFGSHSYVEILSEGRELPLYGTGGFKFYWDPKFDAAMVAFLECLIQFQQEVEKRDTEFCLPYKMEKGKIFDPSTGNSYSIKIQFNWEEQWTKALKFMLTNLKWGLAWVSSQFVAQ